MEKIYKIISRINSGEVKAEDPLGRKKTISAPAGFRTGDHIKVVNGVVVGTVKKEAIKTFVG